MLGFFKNKTGSALIGLLLAIVVIAALAYGGSFYFKKETNQESDINITNTGDIIDTYKNAQEDIAEINEKTEERNKVIKDVIKDEENGQKSLIRVLNIEEGDNLVSPAVIEGETNLEADTLIVELRNNEHETMVKEEMSVRQLGDKKTFKITLNFDFSSTKEGYLAVYEENTKYSSEINLIEIPVKFNNEEKIIN